MGTGICRNVIGSAKEVSLCVCVFNVVSNFLLFVNVRTTEIGGRLVSV